MGAYGANPNLLALAREDADAHTAEEGAGQYASNLAARRTEAFGGADAINSMNLSKALTLAGLASNNANVASSNLANFKPAPSIWQKLALAGVSGASQAAAAWMTGGASAASGAGAGGFGAGLRAGY